MEHMFLVKCFTDSDIFKPKYFTWSEVEEMSMQYFRTSCLGANHSGKHSFS